MAWRTLAAMSDSVILSGSSVATAPQSCFRSSGVPFPVLHRGSGMHSLANDGSLPGVHDLFRSHLSEVLDSPDVVFHLQSKYFDWGAQSKYVTPRS